VKQPLSKGTFRIPATPAHRLGRFTDSCPDEVVDTFHDEEVTAGIAIPALPVQTLPDTIEAARFPRRAGW